MPLGLCFATGLTLGVRGECLSPSLSSGSLLSTSLPRTCFGKASAGTAPHMKALRAPPEGQRFAESRKPPARVGWLRLRASQMRTRKRKPPSCGGCARAMIHWAATAGSKTIGGRERAPSQAPLFFFGLKTPAGGWCHSCVSAPSLPGRPGGNPAFSLPW